MNRKKRKPLDDALADDFVYGDSKPTDDAPEEVESISHIEKQSEKELTLMDKLQVESKEATKRFTVDLAESMHRKLSILSAKTGRSKADIVRFLLDDALKDVDG